jgi:hypothetical protein
MANTYELIASNVLASSTASVTFSAIPSTYTDLVLRASMRDDINNDFTGNPLTFNGNTSSIYSRTQLRGNGATAASVRASNAANIDLASLTPGTQIAANTFNSLEIYIPSYTLSQNKPLSTFAVGEANVTTAYIVINAAIFATTTAISSITLTDGVGGNFVSGSSFYLYGIKNS